MKNKILLFAIATCCSFFSYGQPAHKVIALDDRTHLPDSFTVVAKNNIVKCYERWGIERDTIIFDFLENKPNYEVYKNLTSVVAVTVKNKIYFRKSFLAIANIPNFRIVLVHEMFHTIGGEIRLLDTTFSFVNPGDETILTVTGFRGLSLIVSDLEFDDIEEGAAEYCSFFINNERLENKYHKTAYLINRMSDSGWITIDDIVKARRNSDLKFFCSKILNKNASMFEIVEISAYFNSVQEAQSDPNWIFEKIKELRKK